MPLLQTGMVLERGSVGAGLVGARRVDGAVAGRMAGGVMIFEITNRWNGAIIFSLETESLRLCVEAAVKQNINLRDSNLRGSNLRGSDLRGSNLRGSNLRDSNLRDSKGANKNLVTPLRILLDQPGPVRAYKLVNENGEGPFNGGINYLNLKVDQFSVPSVDTDENKLCAPGIHLATLDWCMHEWKQGYRILIMEFIAADLCVPTATDGKFRVRACRRVGEKDLKEIGLL